MWNDLYSVTNNKDILCPFKIRPHDVNMSYVHRAFLDFLFFFFSFFAVVLVFTALNIFGHSWAALTQGFIQCDGEERSFLTRDLIYLHESVFFVIFHLDRYVLLKVKTAVISEFFSGQMISSTFQRIHDF